MKKQWIYGLIAALCFTLSSCFEQDTLVKVNKDGSGEIISETLFAPQMLGMLEMAAQQSALGGGEAGELNALQKLRSEEEAKKNAEKLGPGVEFVKLEEVEKEGNRGVRQIFKFADINQVNLMPGENLPLDEKDSKKLNDGKQVKVEYKDGILRLKMPESDEQEQAKVQSKVQNTDDAQLQMLQGMFKGMRISYRMQFPDGIKETDATYREGNEITILDVDFSKMMQNPENLRKFQEEKDLSSSQLATMEGVKVETKHISVKLK